MASTKDYLQLHFLVFLWGFTAILGKLVSIPAVEMVFFRTAIAAIGMGAILMVLRGPFRIAGSDLVKLLVTGLIVALHWLSFFASGRISNPSTSLVGFATCSLWAAFLEPWAKKNRIQAVEVGLGIVVLFGLYLIFSFDFEYPAGLALGIVSGFTAALFSVINANLVRRVNAYTITFYEMVGATLGIALFFPVYQNYFSVDGTLHLNPSASDWIYIAVLAVVCTVYAWVVAINLTKKLSVFFIQLTLNLEPVYGILLALLVFGQREVMSVYFYAGTLVILSAVVAYPYLKKRFNRTFPREAES